MQDLRPHLPAPIALVVDGDLAVLREILGLLSEAGWDSLGAPDAVEACELLEFWAPRLVLLDPSLPLAGEVLARVANGPRARLVALCEDGTDLAEPSLWDGWLRKPVQKSELRDLLPAWEIFS